MNRSIKDEADNHNYSIVNRNKLTEAASKCGTSLEPAYDSLEETDDNYKLSSTIRTPPVKKTYFSSFV